MSYIIKYEKWAEENPGASIAKYCRDHNMPRSWEQKLATNKKGWRYPVTRQALCRRAADTAF